LRGDEDIRRIGKDNALLIADAHGIQYLVRDQFAMDTRIASGYWTASCKKKAPEGAFLMRSGGAQALMGEA